MSEQAQSNKFKERLLVVWNHAQVALPAGGGDFHGPEGETKAWRYIPRAFNPPSTAWMVWDRKLQKFLTEAEVWRVPLDKLRDDLHHDA